MEEDDTWKIYGYGGLKMRIMIMHDAPHVSHAMDEEWARTYYGFFFFDTIMAFFYYTVVVSDTYWYGYIMFEFLLMMKIWKRWEYFSSTCVFFLYLCHGTETLEVRNSTHFFYS